MKFLRITLLIILLIGAALFAFYYWGTYSEGVRSGTVVKISRKGYVFKTYEGQLSLLPYGAVKSQDRVIESFEFSVADKEAFVIQELEAASLSGERVSLHYIERYAQFPWRGDTKYFVVKVERQKK
ncbi:MAG: hypothetical protein RL161_169 [Bacteroidota bacterium]|jgi:hypothetical protein